MRTAANDKVQVEAVLAALPETWNEHDMTGFAAHFSDDADFVNIIGMHWRGRAEIESHHVQVHRTIFRNSFLRTLDHSVRFPAPGVALAHVYWEMKGHEPVPGLNLPEIRNGIMLCVLVENGGRWLISAAQNTEIVPISLPE